MERTISVEEKIRRAEEIYARRQQGNSRQIATVNVNKKEKREIKLLKKMIIQLLVSCCIYLCVYAMQNSDYVFSKDFINKINELLSYDTNFGQLYENIKWQIDNFNKGKPNAEQNNGIGGAEQGDDTQENQNEENTENTESEKQNEEETKNTNEAENENLSQAEQDIIGVKNTTTFIKPIEGTISSKYGYRDTATGSVPKNHTGTDIATSTGTKIKSATDGEVVLASEEGDYGKHLKIQIGEVSIIYAHCNSLYVKQGDKVTQGQEIAEVGSTGNSTRSTFTFRNKISGKDG